MSPPKYLVGSSAFGIFCLGISIRIDISILGPVTTLVPKLYPKKKEGKDAFAQCVLDARGAQHMP
ncbi:transmembrane protein, putative [Medicago truncatula]|uniref:Transmembrane protein, putative n=1 Tax=Medicago truncatula TaxID=3880 RepID=G7L8M3_MEDTR|nr:transmembrane protein, putative [Medicago truncatula]